ncbi:MULTISPECIES: hypothetical protein [Prauserella salsuginis group]|uniref:Uncharacterized protein n=2 Tax=Prauserella salsuginis group TaxID=2893672 RepID=A0A839XUH1_9PSEU|nr:MULTISPECIES: hypothetical protein [Prauserella salsuginis group]MBB3666387.1 hypothetical protein [Prauserella sediminis]
MTLRRRRARDRQRLRQTFVDRQPWLRVYADADRALTPPPSEPDTSPPRSTARTRQAHGRPLALGGVTVAAAVATTLLVVRPALAPTSDAPAAGDSGTAETTQLSEPILTRKPVRRQPVDPRAEHDPTNPTTTGHAPGTTRASRPTPPTTDPTVSTTTPTATPDDETTITTTTTTTEPPPDTDDSDEPDTEPERPRPGARPDGLPGEHTHPGRDRPDDGRSDRGPQSLVFSLVDTVAELVDPQR